MLQPKDTDWLNGYKNKTHMHAVYKKLTSDLKTHMTEIERMEKFHANRKQKKAGVTILISGETDLK